MYLFRHMARASAIVVLALALSGVVPTSSPAQESGLPPLLDLTGLTLDDESSPKVFREYWSEDGHWVTEALVGDSMVRVVVYEVVDGVLKQISSEERKLPTVPPVRVRGPNPLKETFDKWTPAVALIERPGGLGSGVILSQDGLILTNRHVVMNSQQVRVAFYNHKDSDGELRRYAARVTAADKVRDLALLEVQDPPAGLGVFTLAEGVKIDPGDPLYAIGHPLGESWTPTQGVASVVREDYEWTHRFTRNKADVVQFQTPISPGNSGGPVIDSGGNLVGVSTFSKQGGQSVNFAVLTHEIKDFVNRSSYYPPDDVHDWKSVTGDRKSFFDASGIENAQECDYENDGVIDVVRFDRDNNGDWDHMLLDMDCDGVFEFFAMDMNEDGYYEVLCLDIEGDGSPDFAFGDNPQIPIPVAVTYLRGN